MIYDVLIKESRIATNAANFCVWYARDQRSIDLASKLMCNVHLRSDICDVLQWQCACAGYDTAQTEEFRGATYFTGLEAISAPQVGASAKHEFLVRPVANTMTFGLYSAIYGSPSH